MRPTRIVHRFARVVPVALALLVMSCASADKLARQSDQALARGDLRGAYEKARRALDKDAGNAGARSAFAAAAGEMSDDYKGRVLRLAQTDTVEAARTALDFRDLRNEIARYPVEPVPDPGYLQQESRIMTGAARQRYRDGQSALAVGRPKEAWRRFSEAMTFDPNYLDVANRVDDAYQRALTRVAVVPFENQVEVPQLTQTLQRTLATELSRRSGSPAFQFTRVLGSDEIENRMTVTESEGLTRDEARDLGRTLGADRVVCGRIGGLRSHSESADWSFPVYHRERVEDANGLTTETWREWPMHVISRERHVEVTCAYEVVDVRSGAVLATETHPYETWARVVWSDFVVTDDVDHYRLAPGDAPFSDSDRAQREWDERMRGITLKDMLTQERERDQREHWNDRYRGEFSGDTREHPVFLGELPPEVAMAAVALRGAWQPVLEALRVLDPQD
ncbi:MAG: hypothetical protein ACHQ52_01895 [Candidatus Eisenbacteria bacterium]